MLLLEKFTAADFETFKSWTNTEEELVQFAGTLFTYPLTDQQLFSYLKMTNKKPLKVIFSETHETIGHCELNFENKQTPRLSRILIGNKKFRGRKLGEAIVLKMLDLVFENKEVTTVDLKVFDWNKGAIKCYENVGFSIQVEKTEKLKVGEKTWLRFTMGFDRSNLSN